MNELIPYEQQLAGKLAEAPLPNIDGAWDAMRKMLDEEEDDKVVPPVNRGCRGAGIAMLVLALLTGGLLIWYMLTHKNQATTAPPANTAAKQDSAIVHSSTQNVKGNNIDTTLISDKENLQVGIDGVTSKSSVSTATQHSTQRMQANVIRHKGAVTNLRALTPVVNTRIEQGVTAQKDSSDVIVNGLPSHITPNQLGQHTDTASNPSKDVIPAAAQPGITQQPVKNTNKPVTNPTPTSDTSHTKTNDHKATEASNDKDKKPFWLGAGLALQQLIPVDGQKATPYNASGRKGSLGDYIPSVYARVYHGKKMLQVEFKYGAPQYAKEVAYDKKIIFHDSTTGTTISNVSRVKKTYYHQLPVSFHYSVLPNFTIGGGFVWNRFQSAVVQQETQSSAGASVDSLVSSKLVTLKRDSATAFAKSYFQFMAEAQYTWKRFSIGARYAWGFQPYLTISSSVNGQQQKERNASLNIFIRFELWQSKKKN